LAIIETMDVDRIWSVLKWVLAALVAGFIGQFGRSLALHLLERRRERRGLSATEAQSPEQSEAGPSEKIAKKLAKAEVKRAKKTPENATKDGADRPR
jgi:hypothetical protein